MGLKELEICVSITYGWLPSKPAYHLRQIHDVVEKKQEKKSGLTHQQPTDRGGIHDMTKVSEVTAAAFALTADVDADNILSNYPLNTKLRQTFARNYVCPVYNSAWRYIDTLSNSNKVDYENAWKKNRRAKTAEIKIFGKTWVLLAN